MERPDNDLCLSGPAAARWPILVKWSNGQGLDFTWKKTDQLMPSICAHFTLDAVQSKNQNVRHPAEFLPFLEFGQKDWPLDSACCQQLDSVVRPLANAAAGGATSCRHLLSSLSSKSPLLNNVATFWKVLITSRSRCSTNRSENRQLVHSEVHHLLPR